MIFLKRLILGGFALGFIFLGGSGTQSSSILAQGGGFVGLVIGIIVLYIFFKMAWRAMGCLPSFIIFSVVVFFILYAIGALSNGVDNLGSSLKNFVGHSVSLQEKESAEYEEDIFDEEDLYPAFEDMPAPVEKNAFQENITAPQPQAPSLNQEASVAPKEKSLGQLIDSITGQVNSGSQIEESAPSGFNPANFPAIYGLPRVINGDTIAIQGNYMKIYGIDAPEASQSCADKRGRSYKCGREAALWLKSWITGNEIECRVMKKDKKGNMVGICSLGEYDIGAALVNAGWAVADIRSVDIYVPYEQQAKSEQRGLWQGRFYMPWDWRELQSRKPKIKIIKPKTKMKSILDI